MSSTTVSLDLISAADDRPFDSVVGRAYQVECMINVPTDGVSPVAAGVPLDSTGTLMCIAGPRPTAEQRAAMTTRAQAGDTLTVAMLDQLGARDALTAWAAAGFPGL